MRNLPPATKNLILICTFVLIIDRLSGSAFMDNVFALHYPSSAHFHFWQPFTYMFMHGGFWHLLMNMFVLYMFGPHLENVWGTRKFLVFYFVCGLGAAATHLGVQWLDIQHNMNLVAEGGSVASEALMNIAQAKNSVTVGASGAIYGILMGFAMLFPDDKITSFLLLLVLIAVSVIFPGSRIIGRLSDIFFILILISLFVPGFSLMHLFIPVTLSAKWWVLIWLGIELATGVTGLDGVAHFAHLGGMLFGFLLIKYWKNKGRMYQYEN